eukprot:c938_g1_i1.p1 GENE.c938_g1_i1~~c938_g1_i1.p1  ORF type:complete len:296 (+),score=79.98 c938_g1_i1:86-973(+)
MHKAPSAQRAPASRPVQARQVRVVGQQRHQVVVQHQQPAPASAHTAESQAAQAEPQLEQPHEVKQHDLLEHMANAHLDTVIATIHPHLAKGTIHCTRCGCVVKLEHQDAMLKVHNGNPFCDKCWEEELTPDSMAVVLVKPHVFEHLANVQDGAKVVQEVTDAIVRTGLLVVDQRYVQLKSYDIDMLTNADAPNETEFANCQGLWVHPMCVAGHNVLDVLSKLTGPEDPKLARETAPQSLRAVLGGDSIKSNVVYVSATEALAARDLDLFFPGAYMVVDAEDETSNLNEAAVAAQS